MKLLLVLLVSALFLALVTSRKIEIEAFVQTNSTEEQVIAYADQLCAYLPEKEMEECNALIAEYTPEFVAILINQTSPLSICTDIKLCNDTISPQPLIDNSTDCEICQYVLSTLASMIADNSTEEEILQAVSQVCTYLPPNMLEPCHELIYDYGDEVIQIVLQKAAPSLMCIELKLCSSILDNLSRFKKIV